MAKEPELEHPTAKNANPAAETWRILFLDSAANVEQLKRACKDVGYVVIGATTIEEAWAFLDGTNHADVIVCAAHLEEESMFDFLRGVRANELHRAATFLILSLEDGARGARLDSSTESAGTALGADAYVVMPRFDAVELVKQVKKLHPNRPLLLQREP